MLLQQKTSNTAWQTAVMVESVPTFPAPELGGSLEGGWTDQDLSTAFALANRWGGQSVWVRPLSMAQHSLTVLELYQRGVKKQGLMEPTATQLLRELLQDADKALLKSIENDEQDIGPHGKDHTAIAYRIRSIIQRRFGLSPRTTVESVCYLHADQQVSASEAVYVAGWKLSEVELLHIGIPPLETDPLVDIYGGIAWEPWPNLVAAERFLEKLQALKTAAQSF